MKRPLPVAVLLAVVLVLGGLSAGVYFLVQAGGDSGEPAAVVVGTATPTPIPPAETLPPPRPTATDAIATPPQPTAPPPTATALPALPPPPPKPDSPSVVRGGEWDNLMGGQWLRFLGCFDFYLPAGWNFSVQVIALDPGGPIIAFTETSSDAFISFWRDSLMERGRADPSGELGPAFEQIASTISTIC